MTCRRCGKDIPDASLYCNVCGARQQLKTKKPRRRVHANGQGSVYKLPNGKWRAERTLGYNLIPPPEGSPEGTQPIKRRVTVTQSNFRTRSDALAALPFLTAKLKAERAGAIRGSGAGKKGEQISLKELYDLWFPTHDRGRSTMNCYAAGFRLFAPLWGLSMCDIEIDDLQDCLDEADIGKRTKENARAALGLVYKYGIPRNCVPKDRNLAKFLRINAEGGGSRQGLSAEELAAVSRLAVEGSVEARRIMCQCYLGFRPTGMLCLRCEDYNAKERAFVGGIKTDAGIDRTVTVSPKIQSYINEALAGRTEGALFTDADGQPLNMRRYRSDFYAVLEIAGIDNPVDEQGRHRLTPHSCRHTFATLMKRVTAPDTDKLALIGHTSTEQLREYQDVSFEDLRRITDNL